MFRITSCRSWILIANMAALSLLHASIAWSQDSPPAKSENGRIFPTVDRFGDPLPAGALFRLGTERFRHRYVGRVVYSPDGNLLASITIPRLTHGEAPQIAILWDVRSGKKLHQLTDVEDLAFSADSQRVAVSAKGHPIRVIEVKSGQILARLPDEARHPFAFSVDGKLVSQGKEGIVVWDAVQFKEALNISIEAAPMEVLGFSPDGKQVLSVDRFYNLRTFDAVTGAKLREKALGSPDEQRSDAASLITANGKFYVDAGYKHFYLKSKKSVGGKNTLRIWDPLTGEKLAQFPGVMRPVRGEQDKGQETEGYLRGLALSLDGKTLAWSEGLDFDTLVDVRSGKARDLLERRGPEDLGLAFSPDGETLAVAGGHGHSVRFWDVATAKEKAGRTSHCGDVYAIDLSRDGKMIATAGNDYTIKLWDRVSGICLRTLNGHISSIHGLRFDPDGKFIASVSNDGTARIWNVATGEEHQDLRRSQGWGATTVITFTADGKIVGAILSEDLKDDPLRFTRAQGVLRLWEMDSGRERLNTTVPVLAFHAAAAVSRDGRWIAIGPRGAGILDNPRPRPFELIETATGRQQTIADPRITWLRHLAFTEDGEVLGVSDPATIHLFQTKTRKYLRAIHPLGDQIQIREFAFSPDGRYVVVSYDGRQNDGITMRLVELASQKPVLEFKSEFHWHSSMNFSADCNTLITGGGLTSAYIWGLEPDSWRQGIPKEKRNRKALMSAWADLAASEGVKAYEAIWTFVASRDDGVAILKEQLPPAEPTPVETIKKLLAGLDHGEFKVRAKATEDLRKLGPRAEGPLRQALVKPSSLEAARRIEKLLVELEQPFHSPEALRHFRAVEVLERLGNSQARTLLEAWAAGDPTARLTIEARQALARLRAKVQ
ncbi:MAG: hypothetical protein HY040_21130 [Planctomycetes bacterium]|nr:hypothetical protein [Planctomycetota bacterium]